MEQNTLIETFKNDLEQAFYNVFPKSGLFVRKSPISDSLFVTMTLGKDKTEWAQGIDHNDPVRVGGLLEHKSDGTFEFDFKPVISNLTPKVKYHVFSSEKIRCQIMKGDKAAIIKKFSAILDKTAKRIKELDDNNEFIHVPFKPSEKVA